MKPVIALNGGSALDWQFRSESTVSYRTYAAAVTAAGGVPLLVNEPDCIEDYAALADGLLLTGSAFFSPDGFGDPELLRREEEERTVFDRMLLLAFAKAGKPVMGICLGLQCINLTFGGTLEDMFKLRTGVEHMFCSHPCLTEPGSVTGGLFGVRFMINSHHNRRIDRLAEDLVATAYAPDGTIEEVRHKTLPIWGFEYHPELMRGDYPEPPDGPDMTFLFRWFAEQCSKGK